MLIQPISLMEFKEEFSIAEEFSIDSIIYKICLLASCHYCIATELNYIKNMNIFYDSDEIIIEKEYREALDLFSLFLPEGSRLYTHVLEGFLKNCNTDFDRKDTREELRTFVNTSHIKNRRKCLTPVPPSTSNKSKHIGKHSTNSPVTKQRRFKASQIYSEI